MFLCQYANNCYSYEIILDPGHSPASPGALSCSGKLEYIFNNELAASIAKILRKRGVKVELSKQFDLNIPLKNRTDQSNGKDLLLSIHHDSVQSQFIFKSPDKLGNCSKKAHGFSIFISRKNPYFEKSLNYANTLGTALLKQGLSPSLHHAEIIDGESRTLLVAEKGIYINDDLVVLKNAKSPAILLEAAVIVDLNDELLASTEKHRTCIANATFDMLNTSW